MAKKVPSILEIDLKKNGGKFSFTSFEEINSWISKELDYFNWLQQTTSKHNNVPYISNHFNSLINQLRTPILQIANNPSQESAYLANFKALAEQYYSGNSLVHSSTSKAKFIPAN